MKKAVLLTLTTMSIFSRLPGATDHAERKRLIEQHQAQPASQEALDRRSRSESLLRTKRVPINQHLPVIDDSRSSTIRTPQKIAERLVACTVCAVGGETGDKELLTGLIAELNAASLLSPKEKRFITKDLQNQTERVQFAWHYERAWVLLWALGYVERLDYPTAICDVPKLATTLRGKSIAQLLKDAKPRSQKEILDEADLIYRLDWAVVNDRVEKTNKVPPDVEKGVVMERHAALNWLINYLKQEWDDITTDT